MRSAVNFDIGISLQGVKRWGGALLILTLAACSAGEGTTSNAAKANSERAQLASQPALAEGQALAVFAGGCFWCMEPPFDALPGVLSTTSGYAGGRAANPTYKQVTAGGTGHYEAIAVVYNPDVVSYTKLLDVFWQNVDPFDNGGQFCDRGASYRTAIFPVSAEQTAAAETSKRALNARLASQGNKSVVTELVPLSADAFYPAETYHQDYYLKNPLRYKYYRTSCGRDRRLAQIWGEPESR